MLRRLFFSLAPSFFLAVAAFGQVSRPTPFVPLGATGRPGLPNRAVDMVTMQYPNSDVLDVLHLYENLTGKKLVMDNNVQGKVNIFIAKPVPREEAIKIIEMNLALNGFSLVPAEGDIIEVIGINKNPRAAAVPIFSDPADIPPGAKVVSFLFKLNYADPQELQQVLAQYLAGIGGQAPILALPKSSSLLVTQSADVLRKLVKMVEQIDTPPAEVKSEFIKLERADATKVVDMMKEIFDKGNQQGQPGGNIRTIRGVVPPGVPQGNDDEGSAVLSEDSLIVGKIKLEADVRTNRIHVITRPINLPFIEKLIGEFDANVEFGKPVTRPLKYIAAAEVLPVLVQALTEPGDQNQQGQGAPGQQQGRNPRANPTPPTNQSSTGGTSGTGGDSTLQVTEELTTQPVDTAPQAVTVGNTKLIADARANSIIVLGNRDVVVKVSKILDEMDVRAPQVALSTVIGELQLTNDEEFGVDYFLKHSNSAVAISRNTSVAIPGPSAAASAAPVNGILDPGGLVNFGNILQNVGSGTNVYVSVAAGLTALVHALDSTGKFKVISRPMVFTSNNKKAIIASGTEIPVPVSTISNTTGSGFINTGLAQQSNIEFKKVALQLEVVPLINSENEVSLDILQKIDSLAGTTVISGNSIPNIATRYIRSTVSAPSGATIVLGGLIQDNKQDNRTGVPILDRLPLVGALFRSTTKSKMRNELIILMHPEVTLTKLDSYRLRQKHEDRTHFGPDLEQDDCPDCPPPADGKQLPPPDLPPQR